MPASSLLDPVTSNVCPLKAERWELRTKALGCGCSTVTLLSVIVTVFATIAALVLLYVLAVLVGKLWKTYVSGAFRGTATEIADDGSREVREWKRGSWLPAHFRRRLDADASKSEQEQFTERSRLLG